MQRPATPVATVPGLRGAARRQARSFSAGLLAFGAGAVALVMVAVLVVLDYRMAQAGHRLVKLLLGAAAMGAVVIQPRIGLFMLPMAVPFLDWMPKIPVLNAANLLVFGTFAAWMAGRAIAGRPMVRGGGLSAALGTLIGITILGLVRGAAFPVVSDYRVQDAAMLLFRSTIGLLIYFMGFAMIRGAKERRRMAAVVALALAAEAAATIALGRNGWGGTRAVGSFGQPNDLGAFLAIFSCLTAAMLAGAGSWAGRAVLAAFTVAGMTAIILTSSRGAFLAVSLGLLFVALRSSKVLAVMLLLVLATSPIWVPSSVKERIMSTQKGVEGSDEKTLDKSNQARLYAWQITLSTAKQHPIDGVGYSGLAYLLQQVKLEEGREDIAGSSHNTYLRMLGEMGVFGLLALLWVLWRCFALAQQGVRLAATRMDRQLAVGLGGATLALAVSCAFGDRFFDIMNTGNFWMLCAIVQDSVAEARAAKA